MDFFAPYFQAIGKRDAEVVFVQPFEISPFNGLQLAKRLLCLYPKERFEEQKTWKIQEPFAHLPGCFRIIFHQPNSTNFEVQKSPWKILRSFLLSKSPPFSGGSLEAFDPVHKAWRLADPLGQRTAGGVNKPEQTKV